MTDKLETIARIIQPNAWPDDSVQMKAARLTAQKVLDALATPDVKALVEEARAIQAQFEFYVNQHLTKGKDDGQEKAAVNLHWASRANRLADALSVAPSDQGDAG